MLNRSLCRIAALLMFALLLAPPAAADVEDTETWTLLKETVFNGRPILDGKDVVRMFIAKRAEDSAVVPVLVRTVDAQKPERFIKKMWLVIDNNPSPIGVTFNFTPDSGRADIETRVRIERYSPVRVVAESSDGKLYMAASTIIAAGGCSAPVMKSESIIRNIGKMKFRLDDEPRPGEPAMAQLMISHPNFSGLAINDPDEPRFVKRVVVSYGGREIMSADVDFTISENPNFRFYFTPSGGGELKAQIIETNDLIYESSIVIKPRG